MDNKKMYNVMKEDISKNLWKFLKDGSAKIEFVTTVKNGVEREGISLISLQEGISASPIVYFEDIISDWVKEDNLEFFKGLASTLEKESMKISSGREKILKKVEERSFYFRLLNAERNKELLKDVPYLEFFDLVLIPYVILENGENGLYSTVAKKDLLKTYNISEAEVIKACFDNLKGNFMESNVQSMRETFISMGFGSIIDSLFGSEDNAMIVVTNKNGHYGAVEILRHEVQEKVYQRLGCDFFIIPSSVHEVLCVPDDGNIKGGRVLQTIREINGTSVIGDEDFLSNSLYKFSRGKGIFKTETE